MNIEEFRARGMESVTIGINRVKGKRGIGAKTRTNYQSTEKATQKACLELLTAKRIFHYRQNTGATRTQSGGYMSYGYPGSPDIIAIIGGCYVGIEIKDSKRGGQNENQIKFQEKLEKAGGIYLLIRSIDELIAFLDNFPKTSHTQK